MARYIDLDRYYKFDTETIYDDRCSSISKNYCDKHYCAECFYDNFNGAEDVRPVIHAKWEICSPKNSFQKIRCTNCKTPSDCIWKYCPNCGAKMDLRISY